MYFKPIIILGNTFLCVCFYLGLEADDQNSSTQESLIIFKCILILNTLALTIKMVIRGVGKGVYPFHEMGLK